MQSLYLDRALVDLGDNLRQARLRRGMSVDDFALRIDVNRKTVMRLEKGDSGVSIGVLGRALVVLGEEKRLATLMDPGSDDAGLLMDRKRLPKRIRKPAKTVRHQEEAAPVEPEEGEYGMGF